MADSYEAREGATERARAQTPHPFFGGLVYGTDIRMVREILRMSDEAGDSGQ